MVIHGWAGTILKKNLSSSLEQGYMRKMGEALDTGTYYFQRGHSAIDVVEKVIVIMEDSPLFNEGKGAVLSTRDIMNWMLQFWMVKA